MLHHAVAGSLVWRSALFVPAINGRAIEKARSLPADCVILDLEDSVADLQKAQARRQTIDALRTGGFPGQLLVRTQMVGDPAFADDVMAAEGADGIVLPKLETVNALELAASASGGQVPLWAMIETPGAVLDIAVIAAASRSLPLVGLIIGPNDLMRTTGISDGGGRRFMLPWLMQIVLAAKANGLAVLDGVFNAYRDDAGFAAECEQAALMGFDGKTLIHPRQIATANAAFVPAPAKIAWAKAVLDAFADPSAKGKNVLTVDGAMIERLHLPLAEAILRRAGQPAVAPRWDEKR